MALAVRSHPRITILDLPSEVLLLIIGYLVNSRSKQDFVSLSRADPLLAKATRAGKFRHLKLTEHRYVYLEDLIDFGLGRHVWYLRLDVCQIFHPTPAARFMRSLLRYGRLRSLEIAAGPTVMHALARIMESLIETLEDLEELSLRVCPRKWGDGNEFWYADCFACNYPDCTFSRLFDTVTFKRPLKSLIIQDVECEMDSLVADLVRLTLSTLCMPDRLTWHIVSGPKPTLIMII